MSRHKGCRILVIEPVHTGSSSVLLVVFLGHPVQSRSRKKERRSNFLEKYLVCGNKGRRKGNYCVQKWNHHSGEEKKKEFFLRYRKNIEREERRRKVGKPLKWKNFGRPGCLQLWAIWFPLLFLLQIKILIWPFLGVRQIQQTHDGASLSSYWGYCSRIKFITVLVVSQSTFSLAPIEVNGFDIKYHSGVRVEIKVTLFAIFFFWMLFTIPI